MRCYEIMKRRIACVASGSSIGDVGRKMRESALAFLPVCADTGEIVGVVTDRDLALAACAAGAPPDAPVDSVMSKRLVACAPDDLVSRAEQLMARHGVHRVLVLDRARRLAGVISLTDVAQYEEPLRLARLVRAVAAHEFRVEAGHA
jgi:CBS domain-containing protein